MRLNSELLREPPGYRIKAAANRSGERWGTALMKTQQWAATKGGGFFGDLSTTEQIFGDPAMPVFNKQNVVPKVSVPAGSF